jgi:hypothetical protein
LMLMTSVSARGELTGNLIDLSPTLILYVCEVL